MLETQESDSSQTSSESSLSTEAGSSQRSSSSSDSSSGYNSSADGGSYRCVATLSGHAGPVASLAVTGKWILSGGSESSDIRVWSQPDMTEVWRFGAGDGSVKALVVLGDHIFSAHQDMKIRVWKMFPSGDQGPKMVATLPTFTDYLLRCLPPKNYVQVRRHKTSLWIQHNDAISVLALGSGDVLYSGSWDKSIKVWRTSDFRCLESITGHNDAVSALVADAHGFLYSGSADCTVKVWERFGKKHELVTTLENHKGSVNALALSPSQRLLYAASGDKTVSVWERTSVTSRSSTSGEEDSDEGVEENPHMALVETLKGHKRAVLCVVAINDIVCTGSADKTIRVWRRIGNSHSLLTVLEGHRCPVKSMKASKDAVESGILLYSGGLDKSVKVWWLPPVKDGESSDDQSASPCPYEDVLPTLKWRTT